MNIAEAINILNIKSADEKDVKTSYRNFCKQYHPDVNSQGGEFMKMGNLAYEFILENWATFVAQFEKCYEEASEQANIPEEIDAIFNKIKYCTGLDVELCGVWLWISGDTRAHKDILKNAGCLWAPKKMMWYWRPDGRKKRWHGKPLNMDDIRTKYGSTQYQTEEARKVA